MKITVDVGMKFVRWTVTGKPEKQGAYIRVECVCDCGTRRFVRTDYLANGRSKSCGCIRDEISTKRLTTHGSEGKRLLTIWRRMNDRTKNKNHHKHHIYFDRNIKVCDEWRSFEMFKEWAIQNGYEDTLSIDRVDNEKGYYPDNCRWATNKAQSRNRRNNFIVEYKGKLYCFAELCEILGCDYGRTYHRIKKIGMTLEEAINTPVIRLRRKYK